MKLEEVQKLFNERDFEEVIHVLELQLIETTKDPDFLSLLIQSYNEYALSLLDINNTQGALDYLKKAENFTEIDSELRSRTYNNIACCYKAQNKSILALKYIEKAIFLFPSGEYHLNKCAILSMSGKHPKALEQALFASIYLQEEIIENLINNQTVNNKKFETLAISFHNLAVELEYLKKTPESISFYTKALNLCEQFFETENKLREKLEEDMMMALKSQKLMKRVEWVSAKKKRIVFKSPNSKSPVTRSQVSPISVKDRKTGPGRKFVSTGVSKMKMMEMRKNEVEMMKTERVFYRDPSIDNEMKDDKDRSADFGINQREKNSFEKRKSFEKTSSCLSERKSSLTSSKAEKEGKICDKTSNSSLKGREGSDSYKAVEYKSEGKSYYPMKGSKNSDSCKEIEHNCEERKSYYSKSGSKKSDSSKEIEHKDNEKSFSSIKGSKKSNSSKEIENKDNEKSYSSIKGSKISSSKNSDYLDDEKSSSVKKSRKTSSSKELEYRENEKSRKTSSSKELEYRENEKSRSSEKAESSQKKWVQGDSEIKSIASNENKSNHSAYSKSSKKLTDSKKSHERTSKSPIDGFESNRSLNNKSSLDHESSSAGILKLDISPSKIPEKPSNSHPQSDKSSKKLSSKKEKNEESSKSKKNESNYSPQKHTSSNKEPENSKKSSIQDSKIWFQLDKKINDSVVESNKEKHFKVSSKNSISKENTSKPEQYPHSEDHSNKSLKLLLDRKDTSKNSEKIKIEEASSKNRPEINSKTASVQSNSSKKSDSVLEKSQKTTEKSILTNLIEIKQEDKTFEQKPNEEEKCSKSQIIKDHSQLSVGSLNSFKNSHEIIQKISISSKEPDKSLNAHHDLEVCSNSFFTSENSSQADSKKSSAKDSASSEINSSKNDLKNSRSFSSSKQNHHSPKSNFTHSQNSIKDSLSQSGSLGHHLPSKSFTENIALEKIIICSNKPSVNQSEESLRVSQINSSAALNIEKWLREAESLYPIPNISHNLSQDSISSLQDHLRSLFSQKKPYNFCLSIINSLISDLILPN